MLVMGGVKALKAVLPAALVCGICFASTQFLVSTYIGPYLTDILASLVAILSLLVLLSVWRPRDVSVDTVHLPPRAERSIVLRAWSPYILLVIFVLLWGYTPFKALLDKATIAIPWPGLDGAIQRLPPVVAKAAPYPAKFTFNILSASGTSALFATICAGLVLRVSFSQWLASVGRTARDLSSRS